MLKQKWKIRKKKGGLKMKWKNQKPTINNETDVLEYAWRDWQSVAVEYRRRWLKAERKLKKGKKQ